MFTGIIEHVGKVEALGRAGAGGSLRVNFAGAADIAAELKLGDSIAVNGCCLTVVDVSIERFAADLSGETLRRTALGEKKPGDPVNLERPLAANARLGGHFVQGHVDGTGRVTRLESEGENWWLSVGVPQDLRRYVAEKGSIAVDGISLTVARWQQGVADFAVIPFTYDHTNVGTLAPGDSVNLECDILAKYVETLFAEANLPAGAGRRTGPKTRATSRLSVSKLVDEGF
ncbi:MAG: riboflavin synthase [Acidobacteriota bacterium]|nr:riboflavin synthase [Acidobacteriota bacterium]